MEKQKRFSMPLAMRLAILFGILTVVFFVFFFVQSTGRIPPLPRVVFSDDDLQHSLRALQSRVKGFQPRDKELEMVKQIEEVHLAETSSISDPLMRTGLETKTNQLRQTAALHVDASQTRYLLLGDWMAADFQSAWDEYFSRDLSATSSGVKSENDPMLTRLRMSGGAFLSRIAASEAIDSRGQLRAARIIPEVIFRVRWRRWVGIRVDEQLSRTELKAYFDFLVAFTSPSAFERRMKSISEIKQLDESYDSDIAQSVVLHEAGDDKKAHALLIKAVEKGRNDSLIRDFARAIAP
ncbi:MAG: hypothetical protein GY854_33205 [Deltaproteobacteria bacterium]|nr:hypothetical protein [Deltaproteobacteria bacterium]